MFDRNMNDDMISNRLIISASILSDISLLSLIAYSSGNHPLSPYSISPPCYILTNACYTQFETVDMLHAGYDNVVYRIYI